MILQLFHSIVENDTDKNINHLSAFFPYIYAIAQIDQEKLLVFLDTLVRNKAYEHLLPDDQSNDNYT